MTDYEIRHFLLQIALKCADLCNPCRPWDISLQWSIQVCKEFYRQGDYERRLRIPVTPICDRLKTTIPKIQVDFFKFVAYPLFVLWHEFLKTDLSQELLLHLKLNYAQWEKRIQKANQRGSLETDINAPLASSEEDLSILGEEDADHDEDSLCSLNKTSIDVSLLEATSFSAGEFPIVSPLPTIILPRSRIGEYTPVVSPISLSTPKVRGAVATRCLSRCRSTCRSL